MRAESARSLPYASRTLPEILRLQAARHGDKLLIAAPTRSITYAEAPDVAARNASRLRAAGAGVGDRIVAFLSDGMELLELWFGAAWLGAILTPINTAFRGEQLRRALSVADPALIVTEGPLLSHLCNLAIQPPAAARFWVMDAAAIADLDSQAPVEPLPPASASPPPYMAQPGDPIAIIYTSGSSGPAKGVICPHGQFFWWGVLTSEALEANSKDVLFTTLPFFHINALNTLWQALLSGAAFAFRNRFSASRYWAEARQAGATVTYLLGAMANILLKAPPGPADRQHSVRIALSPATPAEVAAQFHDRFGVRLIDGYGSTETNLVMSNVIGDYAPGTMGRVVEGFEARIVDEQDRELPSGTPGELTLRHTEPFSFASGYFGDPEATASAWRNLWFHTGDRAMRDERGVYHFVDRAKDAIRRRGENISSWEVEQALLTHPEVENAAVVGVPADLGEEEVMAFVAPRDNNPPAPEAIIRFLQDRLAYFAIPRYLEFMDKLPETENGKVRKQALKERGIGPGTWDRDQSDLNAAQRND